jgi:hypothetical protein
MVCARSLTAHWRGFIIIQLSCPTRAEKALDWLAAARQGLGSVQPDSAARASFELIGHFNPLKHQLEAMADLTSACDGRQFCLPGQ